MLDDLPYYKLSHPEAVTAGGLRLFTETRLGERLLLMYSSQEGLLQRSLNAVNIEPEYGMASNMRALWRPGGVLCRLSAGTGTSWGTSSVNSVRGWVRSPSSRPLPSVNRDDYPW
jgi:hypothetical protein